MKEQNPQEKAYISINGVTKEITPEQEKEIQILLNKAYGKEVYPIKPDEYHHSRKIDEPKPKWEEVVKALYNSDSSLTTPQLSNVMDFLQTLLNKQRINYDTELSVEYERGFDSGKHVAEFGELSELQRLTYISEGSRQMREEIIKWAEKHCHFDEEDDYVIYSEDLIKKLKV